MSNLNIPVQIKTATASGQVPTSLLPGELGLDPWLGRLWWADNNGNKQSASLPSIAAGAPSLTDWRNGLVEMAKFRPYIPMIGAAADGFFDQSGIDVANSVNASYDSVNKLYVNATYNAEELAAMTSDTAPSGQTATASSEASTSYQAWMAFDQNSSTWWAASGGNGTTQSVQRTTPSGRVEGAYAITAVNSNGTGNTQCPVTWTRWGSNDGGTTKTTLDTRTSQAAFAVGERRVYTIPAANQGSYKTYGLTMTANGGDANYYGMAALESLPASTGNLDLRSTTFSAGFTPTKGNLFFVLNPLAGAITVGTNLVASLSQNGGTAYTAMPLTLSGTTLAGYPIYEANGVTLGGTGTQPKWRIQTSGGLGLQVRGAYCKEQ